MQFSTVDISATDEDDASVVGPLFKMEAAAMGARVAGKLDRKSRLNAAKRDGVRVR